VPNDVTLASVPNFRDVAGPGYLTPHGPMRRGRIFRASTFCVADDELELLAPLGIVGIHDLRGPHEVDRRPDVELQGATWRHAWVPNLPSEVLARLETAADMRDAMVDHYRGFVTDAAKRAGFAALLSGIAEHDGPQVFHCSEGKDRTGWAAMLLQRLVGVSDEDVLADFLLTNELMSGTGPSLELARAIWGDRPDEFFRPVMVADADYLYAGLEQLEVDYSDLEGYLRRGLGLDDGQLDRLYRHLIER
jgi:protein-tyrosine phosphatase